MSIAQRHSVRGPQRRSAIVPNTLGNGPCYRALGADLMQGSAGPLPLRFADKCLEEAENATADGSTARVTR